MQIPTRRDDGWPARAVWVAPGSRFAESFRHLAQRVRAQLAGEASSSVLVTSCLPGEGKTITACNLALALRSLGGGERIALVDLDLRVPGVAPALGLEPKVGVEEVLRGTASLEAVCLPTDAGIDVFPAATAHAASYELLVRPELGELLRKLEATHRWIICDSAPLLALADTALLFAQVRTCLTVVRSGRTPRAALYELLDRLPADKRLGFFLNDARAPVHARRYYHKNYYQESPRSRAWPWRRP
jgi:Mrp family chromosome partitioning ATPase